MIALATMTTLALSGCQSRSETSVQSTLPENQPAGETKSIIKISELLAGMPWDKLLENGEEKIKAGDWDEAEPYLARAVKESEVFGAEDRRVPRALQDLAEAHMHLERFDLAEAEYRKLATYFQNHKVLDPLNAANAKVNLGRACAGQEHYDDARKSYTEALDIYEHVRGPAHPKTAWILQELAALDYKQGNYEKAIPLYQRAIEIHQKERTEHIGPDSRQKQNQWLMCVAMHQLADVYIRLHRYEKAESLLTRLPALYRQTDDGSGAVESITGSVLDTSKMLESVGDELVSRKKLDHACSVYKQAFDIQMEYAPDSDDYKVIGSKLQKAYMRVGRVADSTKIAKLFSQ